MKTPVPAPWTSANGVVLADRVPRALRSRWTARGVCPGRDLYALFSEHVRDAPGRAAVIDAAGTLDYAGLDAAVRRAATALSEAGRGRADIIGVLLPNGREAVVAELAIAAIGAVALPIPDGRPWRGVTELLERARAAALVTGPGTVDGGARREALPPRCELWTFGRAVPGARSLDAPDAARVARRRPASPDPEAPARILVSSGSEAAPAMVAYSHNAMAGGRGNYVAALHPGSGPVRNLVLVSLASSFGSCGVPVTLARHGGTLVVLPRFEAEAALEAVERHRPTHLTGVPTMLRRMAEHPSAGDRDLSSLRVVVASGAPLLQEVRDACARRFGRPVVNVYGSTDGVNCHTGRDPDRWTPGLAGRPDPDVAEISVRDDRGHPVPAGRTGEIWALGPMSPLCYVAAPELDAARRAPGGWVRTGDLGRMDEDGTLWVLDRIRRVVIRGGVNLSPAEVERGLSAHPGVADAHCVPVRDPDLGERLCACVVPRSAADPPDPAALTAFLLHERGLDRRALPERFLVLPELPLGPTGKVCTATLTRMAAARAGAEPQHPPHASEEDPVQSTTPAPDGRADASRYVFDNHSEHAFDQHRFLAAAYDAMTTERLSQTGVGPGWRCLEVGAGGGSVATWLARRVGPTGHVTATDIKPERIPAVAGLEVLSHDIVRDPLPEAAFDLIHSRLVLLHLPERIAVLDRLVRALKPGGVLQLDEFDITYGPGLLMPDREAGKLYETFLEAKIRVMDRAGADPAWGREAAAAMGRAGLTDVDPRPRLELWDADSPGVHLIAHHTRHLRDQFVREGMTDQQLADVRALLADPAFRASSCVIYSVQGRRPEEAA
ncbi:AMP-binding protein [Nocardiopsis aegyptia]|uniref:Acyl-CoA synthetase (AMP-forming)/AMP-acid ligase II/ubiquinone/menaquinone biosynthesis C-methylase UbiE n=1 Tax=Nocardiopsis aegyptia TaxID=220378 RepID=A0A7Z0EJL9_9ACTN|nr:AMP-binding protein [Nocardiopsis aegyptia]NYJ33177.1 acyl-CoA synthetase (AMP-forming)/AMP-acid ligase II/ubiquinone/menaquinone biosynthesis C-methylase UbiE [Nocardiopsis aegyptia]